MEITAPIHVTPEEETLIDMHSVLNVMNVIVFELMRISDHLDDDDTITPLIDTTVDTAELLRNPDEAYRQVANVESYVATVTATLEEAVDRNGATEDQMISESVANLETIFSVLRVRAKEITARHADPDAWVEHSIAQLQRNFQSVFQAIEQNSHGEYRIVNNIADHEAGSYLVNFEITSISSKTIVMPAIFQDVMRDTLANARKYTPAGGTITAGLHQSATELRYVVEDTGHGIPEDEIAAVIGFGYRATNTKDHPTRGGGFGLTKAWYVTRRFGGRMWITSSVFSPDSAVKHGTRIEIRIPLPA
jgi:signal transduction histidine kinase